MKSIFNKLEPDLWANKLSNPTWINFICITVLQIKHYSEKESETTKKNAREKTPCFEKNIEA